MLQKIWLDINLGEFVSTRTYKGHGKAKRRVDKYPVDFERRSHLWQEDIDPR